MKRSHQVFIAGATGYMGQRAIPALLARGHRVRALAREGSRGKLPAGSEAVVGNALDETTFDSRVAPADTFLQLVGVSHPSPAKAAEFRSVDQVSVKALAKAAAGAGVFALRLRLRGAAGPRHEGLRPGSGGGGRGHPRRRLERDVRAAVVRARSRPPLALLFPVSTGFSSVTRRRETLRGGFGR